MIAIGVRIPGPCAAAARSRRACQAARAFGLILEDAPCADATPARIPIEPGHITLLTGPSGSGKSTALRAVANALRARGVEAVEAHDVIPPDRPAVDLLGRNAADAMTRLSRAGLGEAACFVRTPAELSEGQRFRLRLAMAMQCAEAFTDSVLLCDEFTSALDRATARSLCALLSRWTARTHRPAIIASSHDDIARWLDAGPTIRFELNRGARIGRRRAAEPLNLCIEQGGWKDWKALRRHHYIAADPATCVDIRRAIVDGSLAGVLVLSMPTLNAVWREPAWGDRYTQGDKRARAARLNAEVRAISRVVVDPRYRGLGIARDLVRDYLRAPLTICTEAVAAMGRFRAFFESAGMRAYPLPPTRRDARLLDALHHAGVEPWRLARPLDALERIERTAQRPFIEDALRIWSRDRDASRGGVARGLPYEDLFREACANVRTERIAYAHTSQELLQGNTGDGEEHTRRPSVQPPRCAT